jgi:hypothetical protein
MGLKEILYQLEKENPNNMEFGQIVRELITEIKTIQSQGITDEQLPGQLDMFK